MFFFEGDQLYEFLNSLLEDKREGCKCFTCYFSYNYIKCYISLLPLCNTSYFRKCQQLCQLYQ